MNEIYTTAQAANFFSVSRRTIQDWIARGYFPNVFKLNPNARRPEYRIPQSDIAKIIALRQNQTRPGAA
jgi:predicted site-specific integrase-resolvase